LSTDPITQTEIEVNWALQQAFKIAVHVAGITDWSKEKPGRTHEVEEMQMEIAKMLLSRMPKGKKR